MKTRLILRAGKKGTRKLLALYGRKLVCVRYRYDEALRRRWKTAEIIIDEAVWEPKPTRLVNIRVNPDEIAIIGQIKEAGGRKLAKQGYWRLRYDKAVALGVEKWIVREKTRITGRAGKASTER